MSNYNDIKQHWAAREIPVAPEDAITSIIEQSKTIRKKQVIGQIVLGITSIILIVFFFYVSAYKNQTVFLGLGIMIGSLLLRIGIEFFAMVKKSNLPSNFDMKQFNQELISFYKRRRYIHFIITPALFVSYILGFRMLLPTFEQELSYGFYTYIHISSWFIFAGLAVLIGVQIRKELALLMDLRHGFEDYQVDND